MESRNVRLPEPTLALAGQPPARASVQKNAVESALAMQRERDIERDKNRPVNLQIVAGNTEPLKEPT